MIHFYQAPFKGLRVYNFLGLLELETDCTVGLCSMYQLQNAKRASSQKRHVVFRFLVISRLTFLVVKNNGLLKGSRDNFWLRNYHFMLSYYRGGNFFLNPGSN